MKKKSNKSKKKMKNIIEGILNDKKFSYSDVIAACSLAAASAQLVYGPEIGNIVAESLVSVSKNLTKNEMKSNVQLLPE